MLAQRSIALANTAHVLAEPIVRRETLADCARAQDVLANAHAHAEQWLAQHKQAAEAEHRQALASCWEQANRLLAELRAYRDTLEQQALAAVQGVLAQGLRQLLDSTTLEERARAVARQLAASQPEAVSATLSVHPELAPAVQGWLAESRFGEHWRLQHDAHLAPGSVRLSHADGAFDVAWDALRDGLLEAMEPR